MRCLGSPRSFGALSAHTKKQSAMAAFFVSMHCVYILYSSSLDRFYTGETEDLVLRLTQHNIGFFKGSSTSLTSDWVVYLKLICMDRFHARRLELFIKKQKSSAFIKRLALNKEMQKDIVEKFK